jgi:hypothetical protein
MQLIKVEVPGMKKALLILSIMTLMIIIACGKHTSPASISYDTASATPTSPSGTATPTATSTVCNSAQIIINNTCSFTACGPLTVDLKYSGITLTSTAVSNGSSVTLTANTAGAYTVIFLISAVPFACPGSCCSTCCIENACGMPDLQFIINLNQCDVKTLVIQDYDVCDSGTANYLPYITGPF